MHSHECTNILVFVEINSIKKGGKWKQCTIFEKNHLFQPNICTFQNKPVSYSGNVSLWFKEPDFCHEIKS